MKPILSFDEHLPQRSRMAINNIEATTPLPRPYVSYGYFRTDPLLIGTIRFTRPMSAMDSGSCCVGNRSTGAVLHIRNQPITTTNEEL